MRIIITRNTFRPTTGEGVRTPDILQKGGIYDIADATAKELIAAKKAVAYVEPKKEEAPKDEAKAKKSKE